MEILAKRKITLLSGLPVVVFVTIAEVLSCVPSISQSLLCMGTALFSMGNDCCTNTTVPKIRQLFKIPIHVNVFRDLGKN